MNWIIFFQTPFNRIKYITNELEDETLLLYDEFLEFIFRTVKVKDSLNFKEAIDTFKTIYLDCITGEWQIKRREIDPKDLSFQNLLKLNPMPEIESNDKTELEYFVQNKKSTLNEYYIKRRKENDITTRYGRR